MVLKKSSDIIKEDGLTGFLKKVSEYVAARSIFLLPNILWRRYLMKDMDEEIEWTADDVHEFDNHTEVKISYDGIWDAPHPPQISSKIGTIKTNKTGSMSFHDSHVIGGRSCFVFSGSYGINPNNIVSSDRIEDIWIYPRQWFKILNCLLDRFRNEYDADSVFVLSFPRSKAFAHWHAETLTKLRTLEKYRDATGTSPKLVFVQQGSVPSTNTWQEESLELLGYAPDYDDPDKIYAKKLIVPSVRYLGGVNSDYKYPSPEDVRWLRNKMNESLPSKEGSFNKRIFISRQDADRRHVTNFDEIKDILDKYGFEVFIPGRMSFKDQVRLFSQAEIIVGPHGAGLMNMVFSAEDTLIIELIVDDEFRNHQFILSNIAGLKYDYVPSTPAGDGCEKIGHQDMKVNTTKLERLLKSTIASSHCSNNNSDASSSVSSHRNSRP